MVRGLQAAPRSPATTLGGLSACGYRGRTSRWAEQLWAFGWVLHVQVRCGGDKVQVRCAADMSAVLLTGWTWCYLVLL